MPPSARPRLPWKALAAVIAALALGQVAPHVAPRTAGWPRDDRPDINVHVEDADPDGLVIDVFDGDDWS